MLQLRLTSPLGLTEAVVRIKLCFSISGFRLHLEGCVALGALNALLRMTGAEVLPTFSRLELLWAADVTIRAVLDLVLSPLISILLLVFVRGRFRLFKDDVHDLDESAKDSSYKRSWHECTVDR